MKWWLKSFKDTFLFSTSGIVQGGVKCGDEYLPGLFTRLTDPNILQFVKNNSGLIQSKLVFKPTL